MAASLTALTLLLALPQLTATEEAELTSTTPVLNEQFGYDVAIDGDTALVANNTLSEGRVYVYVRTGTTWTEQAVLTPADVSPNGNTFGAPLDLDGDVALVSRWQDGSAYVFRRTGSTWVEEQKLVSTSTTWDDFAKAVAIDGDTAVVGGPLFGIFNKGKAYVFERIGGVWTQTQELQGSDTDKDDYFGAAIDLEGDTLVISPEMHDHGGGAVVATSYVFARTGGLWVEEAELVGNGVIALSGGRLMTGEQGMFSVLERSGGGWATTSTLPYTGLVSDADFDGDVFVTSYMFDDTVEPTNPDCNSGSVTLFTYDGATWVQRDDFRGASTDCGDRLGLSVAVDGDTVIAGAPQQLNPSPQGKAHVFRVGPDAPLSYCTAGTSASGCAATLQASGTASVSAGSGLTVSAANVEGGAGGIFFFGTSGRRATPWGNGSSFRCVEPPVRRLGVLSGAGTPGACDGAFALDLNAVWCPTCPRPQLNPGLGTAVQVQLWYSDPANTSNQTSSLSDALELGVGF